jgi:hypothetical protein
MSAPRFILANIVTAFAPDTIGTKVLNAGEFEAILGAAVAARDFAGERVPGQAVVSLPEAACGLVTAGVGRRTADPADYVIRLHRGKVGTYLRRDRASRAESVSCVVYTREAYLADPDVVQESDETARIEASDATHVIVAVLASAGPRPPLTPGRFVHNLAGGNNEALQWTAEEIRERARVINQYSNDWCVVAD